MRRVEHQKISRKLNNSPEKKKRRNQVYNSPEKILLRQKKMEDKNTKSEQNKHVELMKLKDLLTNDILQ